MISQNIWERKTCVNDLMNIYLSNIFPKYAFRQKDFTKMSKLFWSLQASVVGWKVHLAIQQD